MKNFLICIFVIFPLCAYTQISNKEEYKKDLMDYVYSSNNLILLSKLKNTDKWDGGLSTSENNYSTAYYKYKFGGVSLFNSDDFEKYKVRPEAYTYYGDEPLDVLPAGSTQVVYMGGHFYYVSIAGFRASGRGSNLSGWKTKKISAKSKSILRFVYDMPIR